MLKILGKEWILQEERRCTKAGNRTKSSKLGAINYIKELWYTDCHPFREKRKETKK